MTGIDATVVTYRATPELITAMIRGDVDFGIDYYAAFQPVPDDPRIRVLAMTGEKRSPLLPDVPTLKESGYPDLVVTTWNGLSAPKGVSDEIVKILNQAMVEVAADANLQQHMLKFGLTAGGSTPEEMTANMTPDPVLMRLARGFVDLPEYCRKLTEPLGAKSTFTMTKGNYLVDGYETWGHVNIVEVPGFDPLAEYPQVRAETDGGKRVFKVVQENVRTRGIEVRCSTPVERLWHENGEVKGVVAGGKRITARRAVILCCGGFEAAADLQRQFWPIPPAYPAATLGNTGDGIRMAQELGAGLWHMWHFHGVYGFHHPDPEYRLGIRVRRMRNWVPGVQSRQDNKMSWILVDQSGRRFMNEYEPYSQDTNHRPMALYDPVTLGHPRIPAIIVVDSKGRSLYPLADPTWNDAPTSKRFGSLSASDFDNQVLITKDSLDEIAAEFKMDRGTFRSTIAEWNAGCAAGIDKAFDRVPGSMMPIAEPPFSAGLVWPVVSNTQGGIPHDEEQRVINSFDEPIPRLFVAGELGSAFGYLYIAGGNLSECFIGGCIAGNNAARLEPRN